MNISNIFLTLTSKYDIGLVSSEEMIRSASVICNSLKHIPCIGDGDTGYGNPMNVKRTVAKYSQAGMAGIMIEDQVYIYLYY